ncbi:calmodulin-binding transcription activator 4 isoform X2 [Brachypodium distachyon]|uniref:CG-1 domain-containing protein n=1 Tax=Brachypodium distachyon TaxID=15368 RepID=A0A0Q3GJH0_BRADI|nr:calmodulin-binding transcription activator 4 isoform X2 [Brachypodium distachyon]KQK11272.1 hypothetical protein BRADI_2g59137v3 [Brachypodium distachyon]|eukprot:XP_024316087.1 calmodulin-binding transcription activator 4 isoform X2 [Brachypodium distachyon]
MQQQGFDIQKLQQEVKTRWLKPPEVLKILQNFELFPVQHKPPQKPPSGSWFLFNRRVLRNFRNDGYDWRRKKNGKTFAEAHEYLKVDTVKALNCYYAQADKNSTFQKRIYWMLDPAYEHIVLVHYRDILENGSASRADAYGSPGLTSELIGQRLNSCSPGSGEEVSSQIATINNETTNTSQFDWLRMLEMQLSLENKERHDVNTDEVLPNDPIPVHEIRNEELDTCTNNVDIFNRLEPIEDNHAEGSHLYPNAIDVLKNSDTWLDEDQLESILQSAPVIVNESQWFHIHEVCPEWAFCSDSTKVVIAGDFLCNPSNSSWAILFGDVKVPVENVQEGVIRCHTPPDLGAGKVRMCMVDENEKPCSEAREFEFVEKPIKSTIDGNGKSCSEAREFEFQQKPGISGDGLSLLLNYVQMLFDGHGCGLFSKFRLPLPDVQCGFQVDPSDIINRTCEKLDHETTVTCVMEVMLNNKFEDWLSSKSEQNSEGNYLLPKKYHGVIHTIAALGYDWALKPLLSSGVPINYRDANGWTALHWAARFGREQMVGVLLAAGAAAGALSDPTSEDPVAKTPASIATAYGFDGLSAFLSEAQLTTHLHSLESKENGNPIDHTLGEGISNAVVRISDKCAHVDGGTDDQLALQDSLGAIRNAVQAAGRIQATFRVFSLKKKHKMALREAGAASRAMLDKAAMSIQKNFRCWKKRKEFRKVRKYVIKIQARVRAHQERKKYKELLQSVGILEKVMLRWFRKGVGLRGFNTTAMPIDEDEGEDIARVFRKERVETAVNEAVLRVSAIVGSPLARLQYRRMLEIHQQAKHAHEKSVS